MLATSAFSNAGGGRKAYLLSASHPGILGWQTFDERALDQRVGS
jgi:hypothetical protein